MTTKTNQNLYSLRMEIMNVARNSKAQALMNREDECQ